MSAPTGFGAGDPERLRRRRLTRSLATRGLCPAPDARRFRDTVAEAGRSAPVADTGQARYAFGVGHAFGSAAARALGLPPAESDPTAHLCGLAHLAAALFDEAVDGAGMPDDFSLAEVLAAFEHPPPNVEGSALRRSALAFASGVSTHVPGASRRREIVGTVIRMHRSAAHAATFGLDTPPPTISELLAPGAASFRLLALCAGGGDRRTDALAEAFDHLGCAVQLHDDLLDIAEDRRAQRWTTTWLLYDQAADDDAWRHPQALRHRAVADLSSSLALDEALGALCDEIVTAVTILDDAGVPSRGVRDLIVSLVAEPV